MTIKLASFLTPVGIAVVLAFILGFGLAVHASTITTILGTDTLTSSRAVINTNFSNLNTDKLENNSLTATLRIGALTLGSMTATSTATSTMSGGLYASLISAPYFHATSTTATSTFAGAIGALNFANTSLTSGKLVGTGAGGYQTDITVGSGLTLSGGTLTGAAASVFPFTVQSYGVSTTTVIDFRSGLISVASSTISRISNLTSNALITTSGGDGTLGSYGGASACSSNNFVTTISATGGTTCGTAAISGVNLGGTLANLTATDGTLTFSGTYTGATARTIGLNLANINSWTGGQTFVTATSTGTLTIPVGAAVTTPIGGNVAIDTTSGQFRWSDVTGTTRVVTPFQYPAFSYSTSSWSGTTTLQLGPVFIPETWNSIVCYTDAGTLNVQFYQNLLKVNTGNTMINASTTMGTTTPTSNNAFPAGAQRSVQIGTPASSPTAIACTVKKSYDSD